MRRVLAVAFLVSSLLTPLYSQNISSGEARLSNFRDQLSAIEDVSLRTTLENSIAAGLIESTVDFSAAVTRAESIANNASPILYSAYGSRDVSAVQKQITQMAAPISGLDRDAVKVIKNIDKRQDELFKDFTGTLPRSYADALALCEKFNPKSGTNDAARLDKDIDTFLASIKNDPVIVHALKVTNTDMSTFKKNWFGSGLGFEHVIAGEVKGSTVSGFHWWFRYYDAERRGNADLVSSIAGVGNNNIYTGSFVWDPDGSGPMPKARKPKGGFINGNSVQAMLALGHIAIEAARSNGNVPGALSFRADINGEEFTWQLYTMGGTIRSLYPMSSTKSKVQELDSEYFEHEEEVLNTNH